MRPCLEGSDIREATNQPSHRRNGLFDLSPLTGKQVVALLHKHKATIEQLALRQNVSKDRLRQIREHGLDEAPLIRDWIKAITREDPGPMPEKCLVRDRQEKSECCFCGYTL